ncbi:hypothetical protein [Bacillus sp. AFS018417]|uniref:hypothetical protein n=1 Tax=Bacillus sp. AFS018417 TaxID=2033491 RepID=UPI0034E97C72
MAGIILGGMYCTTCPLSHYKNESYEENNEISLILKIETVRFPGCFYFYHKKIYLLSN